MVIKTENIIKINIPKKFSEKQIGMFIDMFFKEYKKISANEIFFFDFTQTEWIANQNLLLISGLIKYLYKSKNNIQIKLFPEDVNLMNERQAKQICQIWDVWKLYLIFDEQHFEKFVLNYENNIIPYLYDHFKLPRNNELFDDNVSVIPFVSLNYITNARYENTMNAQLKPVYDLNQIVNNQLLEANCAHPFTSKTISAIITKELYDNFLDHFNKEKSLFNSYQDWAFMSISMKRKHKIDNQNLLQINFDQEELIESKSFFFNKKNNKFKNENIIHFSFIDFGSGIVDTLEDEFKKTTKDNSSDLFPNKYHNNILKFAFNHNSSRNPILDKFDKIDEYIPRGLYDLLVIVKRYKGLMIIRSNYGKILYNFAETNKINDSYSFFDNDKVEFFPGTYISIYIPALIREPHEENFDYSVIRLEPELSNYQKEKSVRNINLFEIVSDLSKNAMRNKELITKISEKLKFENDKNKLTYITFLGVNDSNIIKKVIFFLIGTYEINENNSVIIVHPPQKEYIDKINSLISALDDDGVIQDFKINPIPLIYLSEEKKEILLDWIGIFNSKTKKRLNDLLFDANSFTLKEDLDNDYSSLGNTNLIDKFGNFNSKLPKERTLLEYYNRYETRLFDNIIIEYDCEKKDGIYLCNGNYYQDSFLQLSDVLNSRKYGNIIALLLYENIKRHLNKFYNIHNENNQIKFIAITASSHKILKLIITQDQLNDEQVFSKENCLFLDSYLDFESEIKNKLEANCQYILVCDAIATGKMAFKLDRIISENNSNLFCVAVFVNSISEKFETYNDFQNNFIKKNRFISLFDKPISKFKRSELTDSQLNKEIVRINPYTNIPITLSESITFSDSVLLSNSEFLECIDNNNIEIRFKLFNNIIHSYFFKTSEILKQESSKIISHDFAHSIIFKIFEKLKDKINLENCNFIFYPKNSDIEYLKLEQLQIETKILGKGGVKYIELERYNYENGWKFPHTTDYSRNEIENKEVLIIDDGSCTGDSLYQMITEVSYYNPKTINVLVIIGRIDDHKKEFFSKIKSLRSKNNDNEISENSERSINLNIFFGSHWNIPTLYKEINPLIEESNWFDKILKIQNTPRQIKTYAENIKNEITPKSDEEININKKLIENIDYKYFPKTKDQTINTKKEIITIRNEIGKIIGYRFYKENFIWFNSFIKNFENTNFENKETNKDIEHLLMCLLYEPYLYKRIIQIIPEIKELINNFIEILIFKNYDFSEKLNYKWSKTNLVFLYFIVYSDKDLLKDLTLARFELLSNFIGIEKIDYILFKILYYSPKNKENYNFMFSKFRDIIDNCKTNKKINLFKYFISSIPYGESFEAIIKDLKTEYDKILSTSSEHKESISAKLDLAASNIDTYIKNIDEIYYDIFTDVREDLKLVIDILGKILRLTDEYPSYFSKYISWFENNDNSLRDRYNSICNLLEEIEQIKIDDLHKILKHIREIKDRFCQKGQVPYEIFINPYTFNIKNVIQNNIDDFNLNNSDYQINFDYIEKIDVAFPEYIFKEIVLKAIFNNFLEYADKNDFIHIRFKVDNGFLNIEIINRTLLKTIKRGSLIGTHWIKILNDCPNQIFEYENNEFDNEAIFFIQKLKLKLFTI